MWFLILSLSACVTGWAQITHKTSGFRITTKSICQVRQSTRESYSAGPDRDSNSTLRWEKPCWLPLDLLEDILSTSAGFQTGIWSGLTLHTQGDRSRLRVSPDFHRKKTSCTSGVTCIFHVGCPTSGHTAAQSEHSHWTLTAWTRLRSLRPLPHTICQGKTGRRWRHRSTTPRPSCRRRRRRSRSKLTRFVCALHRLLLDPRSRTPCDAQCPMHVSTLLLRLLPMCTAIALWFTHWLTSALQHGLQLCLYLTFFWARTGFSWCCCEVCGSCPKTMGDRSSDSEVIERNRRGADRGGADSPPRPTPTTPNGTPLPRGPPPARPIHEEHRDMSLALSNAIGQAFLEQGGYLREVLTLLPGQWEYLDAITVQIRPLTPTDSFHPNVLNFEEEDTGHVDEPAEGATEHGEGRNDLGTGSRSGTASSSRNPEPSATTPWTLGVASAKPKNRKPRPYSSACLPLIVFVVRPQPVPNLPYNSGGQDLIELGKQVLSSESIHRNRLSHIHHNRVSSRALGTDLLQMMIIDNGGAQLHKSPPATSSEIEFVQCVAVHFYTHWLARYFFTDEIHTARGLLDSTFPVCAAAIHTHVDVFNRQPRRDVLVILILLKWYKVAMLPVSPLYGLKSASSWYLASLKAGYDRDLPRGDDGNSRLWWVRPSRQPIFTVRHLAEHIPFPYASIRLSRGTWATLHQVGLMLSFLIALLLRVITAGTYEKSLTGRVGPKSDRTRVGSTRTNVVPILLGLIFWLHIVPVNSVSADVRVDVDPTRTSEAVTAKHVGYREALQPGNTYDLPRAAKRSYRRAYARSCRQGGAFYKGVWRPHSWYRPVQITTRPVGTTVRPHKNTKALRTLTWNAGGLHAQVFRELVTYAIDASLDLIYIQETKWSYDANWSTPEFHFVHSAGEKKEDKVGGVLIMVSTRVIKRSFDIQFNVVHPGRLLHVRINMQQSLDLINVYQYAANDHKSTPERRYRLLLSLQKTLQGLPNRNILILAGDMNTTCTPAEKVCRRWVMPATELHNKDSSDLMAILSTYSLSVLNSWIRPRHRQLATFTFGQLASQIDYVICRQSQATNCAKQAAVDTNFPVACWRDGAKHHPQWKPRPDQPPQMDTTKLIADLRSQAPPPALQQLRAAVRHHIYTEAWTDIPQMERGMLSLAQDLYPRRSTPSRTEPEAHNDLSPCARRMWQLFRDMRSHQFTAQGLFTAWQQWTQFSRAHREHKQRAKARSKAGKLELLEQAHTAATQGDMQGVWKVVKTLAPKTKRKQLQLYKEGHIMSPTDEMKWIIQAFGERYGAREHNASFRLREHPPVHITEAEIHRQLGLLPVHKAVPPEAAPAALWRACVDETTPFIAREVNRQWSAPELMIQQEWADANVALLPKAKARTDSRLASDWLTKSSG